MGNILVVWWTGQECLTSTVGRGGIKHLTPWEGTKISSPCAFGARGRNFHTFPWGEVFYTSPSDCWGKVHTHQMYTFFRRVPIWNISYMLLSASYKIFIWIHFRIKIWWKLFLYVNWWYANIGVISCHISRNQRGLARYVVSSKVNPFTTASLTLWGEIC